MGEQLRDVRFQLGLAYGVVGLAGLSFLAWVQTPPDFLPWIAFAVLAVYLEWNAVEVNDRMMASGGMMVQLTAAVALGAGNAALTMAAIAVVGTLNREDLRSRRAFQPAVNFGISVVTAMAAGLVLDLWLYSASRTSDLARFAILAGLAGVVASILNISQVGLVVRLAYGRSERNPWVGLAPLVAIYAAMGATGGLLGGTYLIVGPEVLPLIVAMILIAHFMFSARAQVREAHESTIRGFIKALEARDLYARGHTERVAMFCRLVSEDLGFNAHRTQQLRWAALVHDVGSLAVPRDLLRDRGSLTEEEQDQIEVNINQVHELLESVEFLEGAMQIVRLLETPVHELPLNTFGTDAQILATATEFDRLTSQPRRSDSMSQADAFAALRRLAGDRFDPIIIASLERAIVRTGVTYGAVEVDPSITRESYARQAMYER